MAMDAIRGVGPLQPAGTGRPARGPAGFRVANGRAAAAGPATAPEEVSLAGMLALQELPDPELADREARRRGQDLLAELAALQRDMLGAGGADSGRLARLAEAVPTAADPGLRAVVAGIALRARIEIARRDRSGDPFDAKCTETSS